MIKIIDHIMDRIKKINQYDLCYEFGHAIVFIEYENIIQSKHRIIITSDLHTKSYEVFNLLNDQNLLDDAILICAGDMSGNGIKGNSSDSLPLYKFLLSTKLSHLYFIQGNHDLYSPEQLELRNKDGTRCCLHNQYTESPIGRIGGLNGIIGKDDIKHHKYIESNYVKMMHKLLENQLDIFITHQPPLSIQSNKPSFHIYGHHHQSNIWSSQGLSLNCNVDARVIFMEKSS